MSNIAKQSSGSVSERFIYIFRVMLPFARRSRGWFFYGCLASAGIVATRLAMPWPLQAVVDKWVSPSQSDNGIFAMLLPAGFDFVLSMGVLFLIIILLLGMFDLLGRFYFARFAIGTVHDLREKAFWSLMHAEGRDPEEARIKAIALKKANKAAGGEEDNDDSDIGASQSGDLISCLIGDSARVKGGLRGFILHVATNSVMYLGVAIILFTMDLYMGIAFAAAGAGTAIITALCAARIFENTVRYRKNEGQLAQHIHNALGSDAGDEFFIKINNQSGGSEATLARITGIATWSAHVLFGLAVLCALWVGSNGVEAGRVQIGDLVIVIMYALMTRGPIIRLARQGARTGKIFGAAHRLVQILELKPKNINSGQKVQPIPLHRKIK